MYFSRSYASKFCNVPRRGIPEVVGDQVAVVFRTRRLVRVCGGVLTTTPL